LPLDLMTYLGGPPDPLRVLAERKIREWLESGGGQNLPGRGKPLTLQENPFTPSELRLAFSVMENANLAPDWIEIGRDVEGELSKCREAERTVADRLRRDRLRSRSAAPPVALTIQARSRTCLDEFGEAQRSRYRYVNDLIRRFNNACPIMKLQRTLVDGERLVDDVATRLAAEYLAPAS
jgi:hypothetical protein